MPPGTGWDGGEYTMMHPLDPGDPSIVLAAYAAHDGDRELVLLALPGGLWLLDGRRATDPFDDDERLWPRRCPASRSRATPHRYLKAARREQRPLAPTLAELDALSRRRRRRARAVIPPFPAVAPRTRLVGRLPCVRFA